MAKSFILMVLYPSRSFAFRVIKDDMVAFETPQEGGLEPPIKIRESII